MKELLLKAEQEDKDIRLDIFIVKKLRENNICISRAMVKKLLIEGKLTSLNKVSSSLKCHYRIKPEDNFRLILDTEEKNILKVVAENIPLDIIYEDDAIAIINKPAGLVVHPGAGNKTHTLVNALVFHFKSLSQINPLRPGIVHRLDKDTSGLMVIAKDDTAHIFLSEQFSKHKINRHYVALVKGKMPFKEDIIDLPITRDPHNYKKFTVGVSSKYRTAITRYRTLIAKEKASLIELIPFTGRTHQLRVHLSFIGHPILGDKNYGKNNEFSRLALHSFKLGFMHPYKKKYLEFSLPIPDDFMEYINNLN